MSYYQQTLGKRAELEVCKYLKKHGLMILDKNYRCKLGEIDLIMKDNKMVVFVEVRLRDNKRYASGLESVTYFKQRKIIKTAKFFLKQKRLTNKVMCRFDVVSVKRNLNQFEFRWVKNAFFEQ